MSKVIVIMVLLMNTVIRGFGQCDSGFSYPISVDLFGLCEVSFQLHRTYVNPYDPDVVSVYAEFIGPDNSSYYVNGFYYEDYSFQKHNMGYEVAIHNSSYDGWRIRFTPNQVGNWTFIIRAADSNGSINQSFMNVCHSFTCNYVSNAEGFISKANSRFLKRDVVRKGRRQFRSFYPIGPNVCWYDNLNNNNTMPLGIYKYESYIDSLYGNCNYMRIWMNRYQHLSLYGPEYTQIENGVPKVYFDSTINQKDSAELDYIITYALQHGIAIMPCIFTYGDFNSGNSMDPSDPSVWGNNPFQTVLGVTNDCACSFFTNEEAIRITKNLLRYIVARWGYATNIISWELWNEFDQMAGMCIGFKHFEQHVKSWHDMMANYIRFNDPFNHLISTSLASTNSYAYPIVFEKLDFVQGHNYQDIQNAESIRQLSYRLFKMLDNSFIYYPTKPSFIGEFGFAQGEGVPLIENKDPNGVDLHNSLWSSLFSGSFGPASVWWWNYIDSHGLYSCFTPILNFAQKLPILSDSFTAYHTGKSSGHSLIFTNNLQTYYMTNTANDSIYGWTQDTAFAYQSLRWLTDSAYVEQTIWGPIIYFKKDGVYDASGYVYSLSTDKRPSPSSSDNTITIPIANQPIGSRYLVTWYDSETGQAIPSDEISYSSVYINGEGEKVVSFSFPSSKRDVHQQVVHNTFGDAVFSLILNNLPSKTEQK